MRGALPDDEFESELIVKIADENTFTHEKQQGHGIKLGSIHTHNFTRMLAKIAHSYSIAEFGPNAFSPLLPELVLGNTPLASYLVGGDKSGVQLLDTEPCLHNVYRQDCLSNGVEYILVAIRLFAFVGMPRYHVVVGVKN